METKLWLVNGTVSRTSAKCGVLFGYHVLIAAENPHVKQCGVRHVLCSWSYLPGKRELCRVVNHSKYPVSSKKVNFIGYARM